MFEFKALGNYALESLSRLRQLFIIIWQVFDPVFPVTHAGKTI
jgi:hypothetical protein